MKTWKINLLVIVILLVGMAGFLAYIFWWPNNFHGVEKKALFVSKGEQWNEIVDSLEQNGIIRSRSWFELMVTLSNKEPQLHVGKYEFNDGVSNADLFADLRQGKGIVSITVTLREGRRALSYARTLRRTLRIDTLHFMNLVHDPTFIHSLGVDAPDLEGYLSPNTYNFQWQTNEEEIITRLVHQTQNILDDSLRTRAAQMRMSINEVLTLASLIEGEVVLESERAIISGVYHNRLRKGMPLQADPTIQYIIPDGPRRLYYSDLMIKSPYNTYRNLGLPPGPINNPRAASIVAALYPEKHNFIYFVANGKGGHWFSASYAQHMINVKRFQKEREEQIRLRD